MLITIILLRSLGTNVATLSQFLLVLFLLHLAPLAQPGIKRRRYLLCLPVPPWKGEVLGRYARS